MDSNLGLALFRAMGAFTSLKLQVSACAAAGPSRAITSNIPSDLKPGRLAAFAIGRLLLIGCFMTSPLFPDDCHLAFPCWSLFGSHHQSAKRSSVELHPNSLS